MSQGAKVWFLFGATALLFAAGCQAHTETQPVRHVSTGTRHGSREDQPEAAVNSRPVEGPPPPATHTDAPRIVETRLTHPSGAAICAEDRPELAGVLLAVDLTRYTAPEQRVLLRSWLTNTLSEALLGSNTDLLDHAAAGCGEHLFCVALSPNNAEKAIDRLADFLNTPQLQTFSTARDRAAEQIDELYQRSAAFRLHALTEGLFAGRVLSHVTQPSVLEAALGPGAVLSALPAAVHQTLLQHRAALHVSIFAPSAAETLGQRLLGRLQLKSTASKPSAASYVPTAAIRISDERFPEAQLFLTWPTLTAGSADAARTALGQLAKLVKTRAPGKLVMVHAGDSISPRPALVVVSDWDELLELAPDIEIWGTQLGSAPLPLSSSPPSQPCAPVWASGGAPPGGTAAWGPPQIVIWGAQHAKPTEEQL